MGSVTEPQTFFTGFLIEVDEDEVGSGGFFFTYSG